MITAIVSAIKGPILSVVSRCLGESRMLRLWLWNLVPTQVNMLGSDVSWNCRAPYGMSGQDFFTCSGNLCRASVRGRDLKLVVCEGSFKQNLK